MFGVKDKRSFDQGSGDEALEIEFTVEPQSIDLPVTDEQRNPVAGIVY
jgi:hypothetical protein